MKRILAIAALLFCALLPVTSRAQGTDNDLETDFHARIGLESDRKISKGFHNTIEGELRVGDGGIGRWQLGTGFDYKLNRTFKVGAGYLFIDNKNSSDEWKPRHRVYGDLSASFKGGDWRFSVKERLQMTHRDVNNKYQKVPNALALKSRAKLSYKGFDGWTPYGFVEARLALNDPACTATWSGSAYSNYSFDGYTDTYFNRYRAGIGADIKLGKRNRLSVYGMLDYCYDKNIDTNAKGTTLKSLTYDRTLTGIVGVSHKVSF